jgi:hypothetical protein
MRKHIKYLWYILQHKWYVLEECWKHGLYWQGIVHDISKFSPLEFHAYANKFFGEWPETSIQIEKDMRKKLVKQAFGYAWLHHQHCNKHHWNYWVVNQAKKEAVKMPDRYVVEMICDWSAMSRKFGDTPGEFFLKNRHNMVLHHETERDIASYLAVSLPATASNKHLQPTKTSAV